MSKKLLGGGRVNQPLVDRTHLDFYPTPDCATKILFDREKFDGDILECACGDGKIIRYAKSIGIDNVVGQDISDNDAISGTKGVDFLTYDGHHNNIITNPPFSLASEFILHGMNLFSKKMVFLLRLSFLESENRYHAIYSKFPPSRIHIISKRLPYTQGGIWQKTGGQFCHAWFVWDKTAPKGTQMTFNLPDRDLI